jgi:signal transduction histidine kinase
MLLPASSEFVAICRAQVTLLTQGLGASLSVVYLTQQRTEGAEAELVPVVAHPESAANWVGQNGLPLMFMNQGVRLPHRRLLGQSSDSPPLEAPLEDWLGLDQLGTDPDLTYRLEGKEPAIATPAYDTPNPTSLSAQHQLVLPLMHEQSVLGLLVTGRDDRDWTPWEQSKIEQVANTMALACVLDQRYQWLEQTQQRQQLLRAQQHDATDNLLHQFRNSITALQTFGKLVLKRLLPGDANHSITHSIIRETERLRELAQQLEAVSELDVEIAGPRALAPAAPAIEPSAPPFNDTRDRQNAITVSALSLPKLLPPVPLGAVHVSTVLLPLLSSAQAIAQDRQLTLHVQIAAPLPPVWANSQALREVLNNLIENALKYTPQGGQVQVQARQLPGVATSEDDEEDAWVEITVSDTGPGIPAQDLVHLFERYYRGVQAQTEIPGTGLGLAIAKSLIDQMHGEIDVVSPAQTPFQTAGIPSEPAGRGTTFLVRLEVWKNEPTGDATERPNPTLG